MSSSIFSRSATLQCQIDRFICVVMFARTDSYTVNRSLCTASCPTCWRMSGSRSRARRECSSFRSYVGRPPDHRSGTIQFPHAVSKHKGFSRRAGRLEGGEEPYAHGTKKTVQHAFTGPPSQSWSRPFENTEVPRPIRRQCTVMSMRHAPAAPNAAAEECR